MTALERFRKAERECPHNNIYGGCDVCMTVAIQQAEDDALERAALKAEEYARDGRSVEWVATAICSLKNEKP